jgi:hypothetical protein
MNIVEFYRAEIRALLPRERFQLAKLILNELPDESMIDESSEWAEEDLEEFSAGAWQRIDEALEE